MTSSSGSWWVFTVVVVVSLLQQLCFLNTTTTTAAASRIILSNETDRMALLEFKLMITGDPLGVLSSWNDSTHFCYWYGVSCSRRHVGRVQVLDLRSEKLSGCIPPTFGNLTELIYLLLSDNSLWGEIPLVLENCQNLLYVELAYNNLSGVIPPQLVMSSSSLIYLDLSDNHLSGALPAEVGGLLNLEELDLSHNMLHIGNLSFLRNLVLLNNSLSGGIPSEIGRLRRLQELRLSENSLEGTILSVIGNMQTLQLLDLSGNRISGSIPPTFGNLTELIYLSLSDNNLWGEIPVVFENCRNLVSIELAYNNLSGVIPPQIFRISSSLNYFNLSHNNLSGTLPAEVGRLINLEVLDLSHNMLSGGIPTSLGSCVVLGALYLQDNLLQGIIPPSLGSLRGIQVLDISGNNLSGQIPKSFEGMKLLQIFNLSYNNLEGEVPSSGVFRNGSIISVVGNGKLCGGMAELNLPPCNFIQKKKTFWRHKSIKIVILAVTGLLCLAVMGSCMLIFWFRRRGKQATLSVDDSQLLLSYHDLHKATDGFSATNLIGAGSFGSVYKGFIEANGIGNTVAVKVFNLQRNGASRSFMAECAALKNIRHRNLLRILTVCSGVDYQMNDFKALIYEFLANGSLEEWLHPVGTSTDEPPRTLSFLQRFNAAIDVATAMDYLHHQSGTPIVHCDLKPNNVLLDMDMVAHVGDFGLARFLQSVAEPSPLGHASSSIGVKGTVGYAPPGKSSILKIYKLHH
ncbi:unnamed protein product [Linum tenue]|uniref:non-specific serine/threonine protein kinase n=1 Tax=Linum tenue TaxID=586396 RepID=A0AAV0IK87_9ROSI|nr:unnamed protein product [Linum tenue]